MDRLDLVRRLVGKCFRGCLEVAQEVGWQLVWGLVGNCFGGWLEPVLGLVGSCVRAWLDMGFGGMVEIRFGGDWKLISRLFGC